MSRALEPDPFPAGAAVLIDGRTPATYVAAETWQLSRVHINGQPPGYYGVVRNDRLTADEFLPWVGAPEQPELAL